MNKPTLVFLIPRLGIVDRGAEVFVYELTKRLCLRFSISLYVRASNGSSKLITDLKRQGITIVQLPTPGASDSLTRALEQYRTFWKLLLKLHMTPIEMEMLLFSVVCFPILIIKRPQLVFAVNGVWGAIFCRIVRVLGGTPFVYSSQGGIEPLIARQNPNTYFVFNQNTLNWYKKYFPKLHTIHLPIGVDTKRFSPIGKKATLRLKRPIIMVAAALIPAKRVEQTILAVAQLEVGNLLILGNGPLKKQLARLADRVLAGRYLFTSCTNSQMSGYYRAADIFTFAAIGEEFGLVYLEALASGLAVVAHREAHTNTIIGQAGVLCDTTDVIAYGKALKRALQMRSTFHPRQQAEKFNWKHVALKYQKELLKLLETD